MRGKLFKKYGQDEAATRAIDALLTRLAKKDRLGVRVSDNLLAVNFVLFQEFAEANLAPEIKQLRNQKKQGAGTDHA